jgi:hypothetical protein
MRIDWTAYRPGDSVPDCPSGRYWVVIRGGAVEIATREYNGAMTWIWRTDQGMDDYVTHYAPIDWPIAPA